MQNGTDCGSCEGFSGPHTCDLQVASGQYCSWHKHYGDLEQYTVDVFIGRTGAAYWCDVHLHITTNFCSMANDVWWHKSQSEAFNCAGLNVSVPLDVDDSEFGGCYGGTCQVTN